MNRVKTFILLATLTALLLTAGRLVGGAAGVWLALALAFVLNLGSYWFADRIVLGMYHAREVNLEQSPELYRMIHDLAARAQLPAPRLYIMREQALNAFATGRNPRNGVVVVTEGLVRGLDRSELEAVIAHEVGHIRHRDTLLMALAATFAGALSMLANAAMWGAFLGGRSDEEDSSHVAGLLGILVAPIAATLVQMSISRSREFLADEAAARYTGNPLALASALRKIQYWSQEIPMHAGSPATAHLFIQNPFTLEGVAGLFSTHPPTEKRIARLEAMATGKVPYAV